MGKEIKKSKKDKTHQRIEESSSDLEEVKKAPAQETKAETVNPANLQIFISGIPYESTEGKLIEFFN